MKTIAIKTLIILFMLPFLSLSQRTGCVSGDCENGQGTYKWESGDSFVGEWKDGKKYNGLYKWKKSGDSFDGEYKDGKKYKGLYKYTKNNITYENTYENFELICKKNNIKNFYQPNEIIGHKEYTTIILEDKSTNCEQDVQTIVHSLELKISGQDIKFTFDTGAEGITIGLNQWKKLSLNPNKYVDLNIASEVVGIGGKAPAKYYKLNQLKIGDYIIKNVIIAVVEENKDIIELMNNGDVSKEFNNLLGMGLLSKFSNAKWDMKENKLTLYK